MISKFEHENIRSIFNIPFAELQKDFLNGDAHDKYRYIYVGEVVNVKDPMKIGRVKVKVINLFDEINDNDIPWFLPCNSFVDGAFSVPNVGDYVETFFERGDIYCGKYFAKAVNKDQIPSQASKDYPNTIVLYETEKGSYCTLNKSTGEYKIVQKNTQIVIDSNGKVEINSPDVTIKGGILKVDGTVSPSANTGGFNCLPQCLFTGAFHRGNIITGT